MNTSETLELKLLKESISFFRDDDLWMPEKARSTIKKMLENNSKFSSTEGFYGEGRYKKKKYQLYNDEKFYSVIKRNILILNFLLMF